MNISNKALEIFLNTREDKSATWEKDDFMEFLVVPNRKSINNTLKGKRLKNSFINQIQMEFAVCLPNDFFEKKWNFDQFLAYLDNRQKNTGSNLKMAQKRLQVAKYGDQNLFIFINILLTPIFFLFTPPYNWLYLFLPLLLNGLLLKFKIREVAYYKKLLKKIDELATANLAKQK